MEFITTKFTSGLGAVFTVKIYFISKNLNKEYIRKLNREKFILHNPRRNNNIPIKNDYCYGY